MTSSTYARKPLPGEVSVAKLFEVLRQSGCSPHEACTKLTAALEASDTVVTPQLPGGWLVRLLKDDGGIAIETARQLIDGQQVLFRWRAKGGQPSKRWKSAETELQIHIRRKLGGKLPMFQHGLVNFVSDWFDKFDPPAPNPSKIREKLIAPLYKKISGNYPPFSRNSLGLFRRAQFVMFASSISMVRVPCRLSIALARQKKRRSRRPAGCRCCCGSAFVKLPPT